MAENRCGSRPHVYQGLELFRDLCVMSSWSRTTSKSFVTKCDCDLMQQPLLLDPAFMRLTFIIKTFGIQTFLTQNILGVVHTWKYNLPKKDCKDFLNKNFAEAKILWAPIFLTPTFVDSLTFFLFNMAWHMAKNIDQNSLVL